MAEYTPFKFRFYDKVDAPGDNPEVIVGGDAKIYIGDLSKPYNEWPVVYTNKKTYINGFGYGCDGYAESVSYKIRYTNYDGFTAEYQSSYSCPCKDLVNYLEIGSPTTIYFTNEDEINTIKYSNSWKHVTKSTDTASYCESFTDDGMSAEVDWGGNTINPILVSDVVSQDQLNDDGSRDIYIRKLRDNNSENAITYTIDVWASNHYSGEKIGSITAIVYGAPTYTVTYVHPINISINQGDGGIDETIINCTYKTDTGRSNLYINAIADWKVGTAPNDLPTDKIKASQQKNVAYIDNYVLMIKVLKDCPEGSYSGNWPITYGPNNKYTYYIPYTITISSSTPAAIYYLGSAKDYNHITAIAGPTNQYWKANQPALIYSYYKSEDTGRISYQKPTIEYSNTAPSGSTYLNTLLVRMTNQIPNYSGTYRNMYVHHIGQNIQTPSSAGQYGVDVKFKLGDKTLTIPLTATKSTALANIEIVDLYIKSLAWEGGDVPENPYWMVIKESILELTGLTREDLGLDRDDYIYLGFLFGGNKTISWGWYWIDGPNPWWPDNNNSGNPYQMCEVDSTSSNMSGVDQTAWVGRLEEGVFLEDSAIQKPTIKYFDSITHSEVRTQDIANTERPYDAEIQVSRIEGTN